MNSPLLMTDNSYCNSFPSNTWPQRHSMEDILRVRFPSCDTIYVKGNNTERLRECKEKLLLLLSLWKRFQNINHVICVETDPKAYLRPPMKRTCSAF